METLTPELLEGYLLELLLPPGLGGEERGRLANDGFATSLNHDYDLFLVLILFIKV